MGNLLDMSEYNGEDQDQVIAGYKLALAAPRHLSNYWDRTIRNLMNNPSARDYHFVEAIGYCCWVHEPALKHTEAELWLIYAYYKACMNVWKVVVRLTS